MKKLLTAGLLLSSTALYATNGDNMIAVGAVSSAMGGTGIGNFVGTETVLKNPALLTESKDFEFSFAGTYFSPKVTAKNSLIAQDEKSASDTFLIPAIGLSTKLMDNFYFGLGAFGTSGLGVDYRGDTNGTKGLNKMTTALSIMKFVPALSYKIENFSIGLGAAIQYGTLAIAYDRGVSIAAAMGGGNVGMEGPGSSSSLGLGGQLGLAYKINSLTLGAMYQSKINMEYKYQITQATQDFAMTEAFSDKLAQPAEFGLGASYNFDAFTAAFDYKKVMWSSADGYKQFKWQDQNIFALGLAYKLNAATFRAGYNYAKQPLGDEALTTVTSAANDYSRHTFNALGFPAIIESHFTIGAGYAFTEKFSTDISAVFSPEVTKTAKSFNMQTMSEFNYEVKHSQKSFTIGFNWKF